MKKAIVIGAGIGGIAAAIRLAVKGYAVNVLEANNSFGGKMTQFTLNGYRFDKGPSLFTMPQLVDELFTLAGRNSSDYFRYQRLDVITQYFFADGTRLTAYQEPAKFAAEVEQKLKISREKVEKYLIKSRRIYEATAPTFLHKSLHQVQTYLSGDVLKTIPVLPELGLTTTMHAANTKEFKDKRFVQLLDRFATYNGSDPYQAPATLNLIPHLEHNLGAFYPEGGIYAIAQSLVKLAEELGVHFLYNERAEEILTENNKTTGVRTVKQTLIPAEIVVSNMDVVPTYRKLLPQLTAPEKTLQQPRSSSALIFYWGINREFKELHLHNIFFSKDYKIEFEHIFQRKTISPDPTVYVNITSKLSPEDAPEASENWFVMVNVPHNSGQDWADLVKVTRETVISKLSKALQTDVNAYITCEQVWDPIGIEADTSSFAGALYGSSSNNRLAAFLRHPNFTSKVKGLYFCGGSVHPGGGIPLCLLSAKIVGDLVPSPSDK
ncbi:1-hydroxycarotenoid 3,4-desaturase CrtD [Adhaeribacter radiodurans]|uniref:Phytoene desaturase n=1 Tax=Adhaeribacter radiodurans TaxID=2745197 RepID=A0A7L7LDN6_9BACT|nr:1-hydroxycarotenoid 3,4-desaturase CrtD [Adhaeribacter radiodurans]QMU30962.1 phytoene desaturase [Adhaeribacter radiodurans]